MTEGTESRADHTPGPLKAGDKCWAWYIDLNGKVDLYYCILETVGEQYCSGRLFYDEAFTRSYGRFKDICTPDIELLKPEEMESPIGAARRRGKEYADGILNFVTTSGSIEKAKRDLAHGYQAGYLEGQASLLSENEQLRGEVERLKADAEHWKKRFKDNCEVLTGVNTERMNDIIAQAERIRALEELLRRAMAYPVDPADWDERQKFQKDVESALKWRQ